MMTEMRTDWEIANAAPMRPILDIARERLGIPAEAVEPYGHYKAKIGMDFVARCFAERPDGKLILVTAINPTPAGEGKTTTTVGLGDALNRIGKKAILCLREPSLGPCFGVKGGAAGGGYSQVVPMDEINLHFTGDLHAVAAANNLLAAMIDNHIYWGNEPVVDPRRVSLAALPRHERPRAAPGRLVAGRRRQRLPARGRVRHHRRLGDHGDPVPVAVARRSAAPPRQHHRRRDPRARSRCVRATSRRKAR